MIRTLEYDDTLAGLIALQEVVTRLLADKYYEAVNNNLISPTMVSHKQSSAENRGVTFASFAEKWLYFSRAAEIRVESVRLKFNEVANTDESRISFSRLIKAYLDDNDQNVVYKSKGNAKYFIGMGLRDTSPDVYLPQPVVATTPNIVPPTPSRVPSTPNIVPQPIFQPPQLPQPVFQPPQLPQPVFQPPQLPQHVFQPPQLPQQSLVQIPTLSLVQLPQRPLVQIPTLSFN